MDEPVQQAPNDPALDNFNEIQDDIRHYQVLTDVANQLYGLFRDGAGGSFRDRPIQVAPIRKDEKNPTGRAGAQTDGKMRILMPDEYAGVRMKDHPDEAVGLMGHELMHFMQPTAQMAKTAQLNKAPHWLASALMDLQGEAMLETLFPTMRQPLAKMRELTSNAYMQEYYDAIKANPNDFKKVANLAVLMSRFSDPGSSFSPDRALAHVPRQHHDRTRQLLHYISQARRSQARNLPGLLADIMRTYPDLVAEEQDNDDGDGDGDGNGDGDGQASGQGQGQAPGSGAGNNKGSGQGWDSPTDAAQHEGDENAKVDPSMADLTPDDRVQVIELDKTLKRVVLPAVPGLARRMDSRFESSQGSFEVRAPQRIIRRELATGDPLPFRQDVPGWEAPSKDVVICVDESGSMTYDNGKQKLALAAAQAIALSVSQNGGKVIALTFDTYARVQSINDEWTDGAIFRPISQLSGGGTSFAFLREVWARYPGHKVIVVSDGEGYQPAFTARERARTFGICIPPGDARGLEPFCAKVSTVTSNDLQRLPAIMANLIPHGKMLA